VHPTQLCLLLKRVAAYFSHSWPLSGYCTVFKKKVKCNKCKFIILILLCGIPLVHSYYDTKIIKLFSHSVGNDGFWSSCDHFLDKIKEAQALAVCFVLIGWFVCITQNVRVLVTQESVIVLLLSILHTVSYLHLYI
jgi:hypothetical protein